MKLMFVSDIHGSAHYCQIARELYEKEQADKLILLGDLLYHGPRNHLPQDYDPKQVIQILNGMKHEILCVRGNCDAEVDQMVLEFPIMADYMTIFEQGHMFFITHGHLFNTENLPPFKQGDLLIHGHTHIPVVDVQENYTYINPGSISLPKNDTPNSYMVYQDGLFQIKNISGETFLRYECK